MALLNNLPSAGHAKRTRRGRGESSGLGKTAGRGNKGARARAGYSPSPVTSGIPWYRKLPMRGFSRARFPREYVAVTLRQIAALCGDGTVVDAAALCRAKLIPNEKTRVKVIGNAGLLRPVDIHAHAFSAGSREAILAAGGRAICPEGQATEGSAA